MNSFPILMSVVNGIIWLYLFAILSAILFWIVGSILGLPVFLFKKKEKGIKIVSKVYTYLIIGGLIYGGFILWADMFSRGNPSEIWLNIIVGILILLYFSHKQKKKTNFNENDRVKKFGSITINNSKHYRNELSEYNHYVEEINRCEVDGESYSGEKREILNKMDILIKKNKNTEL